MIECVRVCQYKQIELLVPKCSTDDYQPYTTLQLSVCRRAHTSKCLINYYTLKGTTMGTNIACVCACMCTVYLCI